MFNQTEAILSQYEMEIQEVTKGRGAYICNTSQGRKLLIAFRGSKEKGEFLKAFLEQLNMQGFATEQIVLNRNGEAVTEDEVTGERFIIKDYVAGIELNAAHGEEVKEAVKKLADFHKAASQMDLKLPEKIKSGADSVVEVRQRHCRELVKTRNYIRGRKKKNEFEQIFMREYAPMLETAEQSLAILEKQGEKGPETIICHGDYNQHNVVWTEDGWQIIHFENFVYSWRVLDLANFLRKMLEKNNWDVKMGLEWIRMYHQRFPLEQDGFYQLYGLLLFPEKFWKITNHYMNSRKAWISERDIDKLKKVILQEDERLKFMENLFSIL